MDSIRALILSNNKKVADGIARELKENYCGVNIKFPGEIDETAKIIGSAGNNYDYIIVICLEEHGENSLGEIDNLKFLENSFNVAKRANTKTIIILPYFSAQSEREKLLSYKDKIINDNDFFASVVFSGEIFKDKELIAGRGLFFEILRSLKNNEPVTIERNIEYYLPLELELFSKSIIRRLFSISSFGKAQVMLSIPLTHIRLMDLLGESLGNLKIQIAQKKDEDKISIRKKEFLKADISDAIHVLIAGRSRVNVQKKTDEVRKATNIRKDHPVKKNKRTSLKNPIDRTLLVKVWSSIKSKFMKAVIFMVLLLVLPVIFLLTSLITFRISLYTANKGHLETSRKGLLAADVILNVSSGLSDLLSEIPGLYYPYSFFSEMAEYLSRESEILGKGIEIKEDMVDGFDRILSSDAINLSEFSNNLSLEMEHLSNEIDFFRSDTKELSELSDKIAKRWFFSSKFLNKGKLDDYQILIGSLPNILGENNKKVYLGVVQDNEILRASGGIIESIVFLTFSKGRLIGVETFGVDEIDIKLVGIIEPPTPVNKYFQKKGWFLRDANWFAEFSSSAEQIEWFIDKELDRSVDGVFTINKSLLISAIKIFDNITIEGVGVITEDNVADTLRVAEHDSYPSSQLRSDIPGIFLSRMIDNVYRLNTSNKSRLVDLIIEGLARKDIQVFIHDNNIKRTLSNIGWDGGAGLAGCSGNCYEDYLEIIESNKEGSNVSNIKKQATLDVSIEEGVIKRKLVLFLENAEAKDGVNTEANGPYESYIRIIVPSDAGAGMIEVVEENEKKEVRPEVYGIRGNKEIGVFVELGRSDAVAYVFSWESGTEINMERKGAYSLKWIKQPGVRDFPVEAEINLSVSDMTFDYENLNLTEENGFGYNTTLSRDLVSRIFWQNGAKD